MIDTDKYEDAKKMVEDAGLIDDNDGWLDVYYRKIAHLLAEVKRLREENEQLRKADWEYECLWTWLDENTNLLNTIEPLVEEWKKEMIE